METTSANFENSRYHAIGRYCNNNTTRTARFFFDCRVNDQKFTDLKPNLASFWYLVKVFGPHTEYKSRRFTLHNVTKQGAFETSNFQHSKTSSDSSRSTDAPSMYLPLTFGIRVLCRAALTAREIASYKLPVT